MELEAGKSYTIRWASSDYKKVHIEAILNNTTSSYKGKHQYRIIVFRWWGKFKRRWFYEAETYSTLAIWNDWE